MVGCCVTSSVVTASCYSRNSCFVESLFNVIANKVILCQCVYLFIYVSLLENEVENKKAQLLTSQQHLHSIENEIRQNEDYLNQHRQHQKELQVEIQM